MFGILEHVLVKMDLVIICDEIIEPYEKLSSKDNKEIKTNFNEEKATCKIRNFNILFAFLLIIIVLLISVSIYCYLIKYWPFHDIKLKQIYIDNINWKWVIK